MNELTPHQQHLDSMDARRARILETERAEREQHTNEVFASTPDGNETFMHSKYGLCSLDIQKPQVFACGINSDTRLTPRQYKRAARGAGWEGHKH